MSNLTDYARDELTRAGMLDKDSDYGGMLGDAVLKMVAQFAEEGHSGASASMAISLFERVARWEPLTPLTGADDEWRDISGISADPTWQNIRCSRVFKGSDGAAYDIAGKVFSGPGGLSFTSRDSRVPVTFPYTPKTEYVDVPGEAP